MMLDEAIAKLDACIDEIDIWPGSDSPDIPRLRAAVRDAMLAAARMAYEVSPVEAIMEIDRLLPEGSGGGRRIMAYLKEIVYKCGCGKRQAVALYSFRNEEEGRFCRACGRRALAHRQQIEKEDTAIAQGSEERPT